MIRTALFGAGRMAESHARTIFQSPIATLHCVIDPDLERAKNLASQYDAKFYSSSKEALKDSNIDAALIVSSTDTHADLIMECARARLPIFCEKPIDLDIKRINTCLSVVNEHAVPFFVGFNRRFDPSFQSLKKQVDQGVVGHIELVSISSRDHALPDIAFLKRSGGLFRDMMIHDFDMASWLIGERFVEVYATGSCKVNPDLAKFGDLDTAMVLLKTESGVLCHINNSRRTSYGYDQRIEVFGEKGMLRAHNLSPTTVEHSDHQGIRFDKPHPSFPERYEIAYQIEIEHFFKEVVQEGKTPLVSGEDGRQAIVIADAADHSYRTGKPVSL